MLTIRQAIFPDDAASVLAIWREFVANSPVDLSYQNFAREFADMPGKYAAPRGCILVAENDAATAGCVALREVDAEICEMKRLYVRPVARGQGIGRRLIERLLLDARGVGYREMRLDVQRESLSARYLYRSVGFTDAEPVSFNPVDGASFMGLRL